MRHRNDIQSGDQPWFCYWNSTFIEGFIYMQQRSSNSGNSGNSSSPSNTKGSSQPSNTQTSVAAETPPPPSKASQSNPPNTAQEASSAAAQSAYMAAVSSHVKRWALAAASAAPSAAPSYSIMPTPNPEPFPFIVKIQERRIPSSTQVVPPYCQKMVVPEDGPPIPVTDDDGKPIRINLLEHDPSLHDFSTAFEPKKTQSAHKDHNRRYDHLFKREDPPKSCHCLWVSPFQP